MATTPQDPKDTVEPATPAPSTDQVTEPVYEAPRLIEYGPLAKITQGTGGSTGESANSKKHP